MIRKLLSYFNTYYELFQKNNSYGRRLEEYIISKNPKSIADVEHIIEQLNRNNNQRSWI